MWGQPTEEKETETKRKKKKEKDKDLAPERVTLCE